MRNGKASRLKVLTSSDTMNRMKALFQEMQSKKGSRKRAPLAGGLIADSGAVEHAQAPPRQALVQGPCPTQHRRRRPVAWGTKERTLRRDPTV